MTITKLKKFNKKAKRLTNTKILQLLKEIVVKDLELIAIANREQLLEGKTAENKPIQPEYASTIYAAQKQNNPKRSFLTPNLKDTGKFHESVYAKIEGNIVKIGATDGKTKELQIKYGNEILGLTDENKNDLIREWKIKLRIHISSFLFGA